MSEHEDSVANSSVFSGYECQQLRKKVTLSSSELIQLTYNEQKFNSKLQLLNKNAKNLIEQDKYQQAGVYLDQAEKVLEYAAGCGKTIERTLITTILNNQACLLQRNSDFQQSANYLEAIIFNIGQFLEGCHEFQTSPQLANCQSSQFAETATFFQRKTALALYHLRFCALTSHSKNNQVALKSARKAMTVLKEVCRDEYFYQTFKEKNQIQSSGTIQSSSSKSMEIFKTKHILRDLSNLKTIQLGQPNIFQKYLKKAAKQINAYQKRIIYYSYVSTDFVQFENYSIGNLMQAAPVDINSKPNHADYMDGQISSKGKIYKIIHMAMAHFTIATQLRLISANKYSLDDDERKLSLQFCESKVYHLLALTIVARYLPSKSVFFQHAVTSFKNHYGIDLLQLAEKEDDSDIRDSFTIMQYEESSQQEEKGQLSRLEEGNTYEDDNDNKSIQIIEVQSPKSNELIKNMMSNEYNPVSPKMGQTLMKQIHNSKPEIKKLKNLKSKTKNNHLRGGSSSSRVIEGAKIQMSGTLKNKQNKSKSKLMLQSKGKETMRSRQKILKTEQDQQDRRNIYYGYNTKQSRSKSRRSTLERKGSKKGLGLKQGLIFQNKKVKNQVKIDEEYGAKSTGQFGVSNTLKSPKVKNLRHSQGSDDQNIYMTKSGARFQAPKLKKLKSPRNKNQGANKKKSVSKDRYF